MHSIDLDACGSCSSAPQNPTWEARSKIRACTRIPSYGLTLIWVQISVTHPLDEVWPWWAIYYPTTWVSTAHDPCMAGWRFLSAHKFALFPQLQWFVRDIMFSFGHNTKGGSNGHFNHVDPVKVSVSSLFFLSLFVLIGVGIAVWNIPTCCYNLLPN